MTPFFDAGGTLPRGLNKVRNNTGAPEPLMTNPRVAALDRRNDLAAAIASAFFGTVLGAAFTAGFLAGRLTARSTP